MVVKELNEGNVAVTADVIRIMGITSNSSRTTVTLADAQRLSEDSEATTDVLSIDSEQLCASILHTVYMGTCNSSAATQSRSLRLAQSIGAYHNTINIDTIVAAVLGVFTTLSSACAFHPPGTIRSQVLPCLPLTFPPCLPLTSSPSLPSTIPSSSPSYPSSFPPYLSTSPLSPFPLPFIPPFLPAFLPCVHPFFQPTLPSSNLSSPFLTSSLPSLPFHPCFLFASVIER